MPVPVGGSAHYGSFEKTGPGTIMGKARATAEAAGQLKVTVGARGDPAYTIIRSFTGPGGLEVLNLRVA